MNFIKNWLNEQGYEKYQEARNHVESAIEDQKEPYKSKYKARDIFKTLQCRLEDIIETYDLSLESSILDCSSNYHHHETLPLPSYLVLLINTLNYELAVNFIECEEITTGEDYLKKCLGNLTPFLENNVFATLLLAVYNQLGIIWCNRSSFQEALKHLKLCEDLYIKTIKNGCTSPIAYTEIWKNQEQKFSIQAREDFFENLHTLTLYYLAQVYNNLNQAAISAKYCHQTLSRQMKTKQYNPKEWSLNCATLSQYYVTQDNFSFARYCLACAGVINKEAFVNIDVKEDETYSQNEDAVFKSRADIYRCWAKYGLNLMKLSHEKNMKGELTDSNDEVTGTTVDEEKLYAFGDLEVNHIENQVTDQFIKNYDGAKSLFSYSVSCLKSAKEFYKLDGYVSDYVEITQDISQLHKYLAFYDNEFENRCKLHKRRIDMLNAILLELNPQHFLQICRQLTFEIAETYTEMAELKKCIIEENPSKFSVNSVKKINYLLLQGIKFYQGFVDSYKKNGELPSQFEDDDVRGILMCFFCMARLNSKYYTNEKQTKVSYLNKEKECYEFIVNYCDSHPEMPNVFDEELSVSREMLGLFEAKRINVLRSM